MKRLICICLFGIISILAIKAQENWQVYLAQYEDGVGSTIVDMGHVDTAPNKFLPYVLVTGVTYQDCDSTGFPNKPEFENLYAISDSVVELIYKMNNNVIVGTFTLLCERLDYFYLTDTTNVRAALTALYNSQFPTYDFYINLEEDKEWEFYLDFLYPNEQIQESMSNRDVLMSLEDAGDDLTEPRQIDHWVYFKNKQNRAEYAKYIVESGYEIQNESKVKGYEFGYSIQFSRVDYVDLGSINEITWELSEKARELNGEYDGWETFVITSK